MSARAVLLVATVALASGWIACSGERLSQATEPAASLPWVELRGTRVEVELARTRAEQMQGLSDRPGLAWGRGMLFQYRTPSFQRFWMKRMHFPIDIVWIRALRVVSVSHRVPPPPPDTADHRLRTYGPRELVDSVLEVPAGFAEAHGWQRGDVVTLSPDAQLP